MIERITMKRLSLIVVIILLMVSCSKPKVETPPPPQTSETTTETIKPAPKPPEKPKVMTYEDYKDKILDQLAYMKNFETQTDTLVEASGGSFLMPGFEVVVDKNLKHQQRPLETHVKINTTGPFFLNLGPARHEIYTKDGDVFTYDESSQQFKEDKTTRPNQILDKYDAESMIQQKLWRKHKMDLQTEKRLIAKLTLKGEDARELVDEIFRKYGIAFDFDEKEITEEVELTMEYDPKTYFPKTMAIKGKTKALGYTLDITIDVKYSNVK